MIKRDEATPDATRMYRKFMTNTVNIARALRTKNNLSALGPDGIGYLLLKMGNQPMIKFISYLFKRCLREGDVPDTWKQSKTVFLYKKGDSSAPNNWRPITITSCLYRLFMSMNATFIQMKMHKQDNIRIFSNSQKGFVAGVPGCMEHAVMARELMAHAITQKRDLHMIQIDFTNAFGSVPHGSIAYNMRCMGLPDILIDTVMNVYEGATTVIAVPTGVTGPIKWKSGTVQGCPLSPALFNICLESFLRLLERPEYKSYGFEVRKRSPDGFNPGDLVTSVNVAAYADDLILFSGTRDGAQAMLDALADFCNYSGMEANVAKCVSASITFQDGIREDQFEPLYMRKGRCPINRLGMPIEDEMANYCHPEPIPIQEASIYLGLPIGADKEECAMHGKRVLASMKDHIIKLGKSNLNIAQKLEGIKMMELPRIDYRMMCADLTKPDLKKFDSWLRGQIQGWLKLRGIPQGMAGMSWRDGGFTLPSLEDRQNTMVIRTICDIMTSKDPQIIQMMAIFEEEQAHKWGMEIAERLNPEDNKGFLRWTGQNPDWREYPVTKVQSIFPGAFKSVQEADISVYIADGKAFLHHDRAESFSISKFSRPAMWITQSVQKPIHADTFKEKIQASRGFHYLDDNPASNHFMNWATSKYDDAVLKFAIGIRLNMLKTPRTVHRDGDRDIQCCWCGEMNPDMAHIMCNCKGNGRGWHFMKKRHEAIVQAVEKAIRKGHGGKVNIREDDTIKSICSSITDGQGGLKRPDLMYESFVTKRGVTKKIFNMT
jgi:hypothetical protein